jgi:hypothetical protein
LNRSEPRTEPDPRFVAHVATRQQHAAGAAGTWQSRLALPAAAVAVADAAAPAPKRLRATQLFLGWPDRQHITSRHRHHIVICIFIITVIIPSAANYVRRAEQDEPFSSRGPVSPRMSWFPYTTARAGAELEGVPGWPGVRGLYSCATSQ